MGDLQMTRGALPHLFASMVVALMMMTAPSSPARAQVMEVFKTPSCGCCTLWMRHVGRAGFSPKGKDLETKDLTQYKTDAGIPTKLQSCHTARIDGYIIEGHVPAADIRRLLKERPDAIGLAVPGMPIGSPGMESGNEREPYQVLLIRRDGRIEVFSQY